MNQPAKLLLVALAAIGVGVALIVMSSQGSPSGPTTDPDAPAVPDPETVRTETAGTSPTNPDPIERRIVSPTEEDSALAQGVIGRVVDSTGTPVVDAEVLLFEGNSRDPLQALLAAQRGASPLPIGRAVTGSDGRFALGVQRVSPSGYELRLTHPDFAHHAVPDLTLFADRWIELDAVTVDPGVALEGQVTVQGGGGLPVANATVTVTRSGALPTIDPSGSREPGTIGTSDAAGFFRIEHCNPGLATVAAVAPGFARVERRAVELQRDAQNRLVLELPKGESIAGLVTDPEGLGIAGATVEAFALSAKTPVRLRARTDPDGRFEVIGLTRSPYQLTATAPGFVTEQVKPVAAGSTDEHITLQAQSAILVAVTAPDGRTIQRFDVELKTYDSERDQLAHVTTARLHQVVPDDLIDGYYAIDEVDPGTYVLQVEARGFAKTFSQPFSIERGRPSSRVAVTMMLGGRLVGTVIGQDGTPVVGADVETTPNRYEENALTRMFRGMVPERITRVSARTGPDGAFTLERLSPGSYQIRFRHPNHFDLAVNDLVVEEGSALDLGSIRLGRGTELVGTALLDGLPAGQIRVSVSSVPDPLDPTAPGFMAETTSRDDGRFRFSRRLPPGRYQARAARQSLPTPLLQVLDFAKTRQDFQIARGQESHQLHFTLTSE